MKAVRGEEEEEEEEEVEAEEALLGEGTAPQKPDFSDFFRAPAGDGIPAKNHDDDEDEERLSGRVSLLFILHFYSPPVVERKWEEGEGGGGRSEAEEGGGRREAEEGGVRSEAEE